MTRPGICIALTVLASLLAHGVPAQTPPETSPRPLSRPAYPPEPRGRDIDVLVVGDSQISFGAGAFYLDLFENFATRCVRNRRQRALARRLGDATTAAIGVRSSALHSWVARRGRAKDTICKIDPRFGVNAGTYGVARTRGRTYAQMGRGRDFQICRPGQSPFEAMFADRYYDPRLLVLAFLGNSADRWARRPATARRDLALTLAQIPARTPCVLLTTAPAYLATINDRRALAQANLLRAHADLGGRCSLVAGFSEASRAAIEGQAAFFTQDADGVVTDPLHPNSAAFSEYFALTTPRICAAVFDQLDREGAAR